MSDSLLCPTCHTPVTWAQWHGLNAPFEVVALAGVLERHRGSLHFRHLHSGFYTLHVCPRPICATQEPQEGTVPREDIR